MPLDKAGRVSEGLHVHTEGHAQEVRDDGPEGQLLGKEPGVGSDHSSAPSLLLLSVSPSLKQG